jgi:hypothetical protein
MIANQKQQPHRFQDGNIVFLLLKNLLLTDAHEHILINNQGYRKGFLYKYIGEFEQGKRRGVNAFEVLLPEH